MMRALISDLGNVLLHFDHGIIERRLTEQFPDAPRDADTVAEFWKLVHAFETGQSGIDDFFAQMARLLNLAEPLDEVEFSELWGDIFWLNTDLVNVLEQVHDSLTLVLLSNTNPLHIAFAKQHFPELFRLFDHTVYSYATGFGKPDRRMYTYALEVAEVRAEEALYFDDIAAYTDAASEIGVHAYQYVSLASLMDVLRIYDVPLGDITKHNNFPVQ